ncbi:hypothetical protein V6Z11_D13G047800 [Gossypium hirsutum]
MATLISSTSSLPLVLLLSSNRHLHMNDVLENLCQ